MKITKVELFTVSVPLRRRSVTLLQSTSGKHIF
jgi:hypothetical protein